MNKSSCILAAMAAIYAVSVSVHAEEIPQDAVVVTATRTAQTADDTLASVTVITRRDIERLQTRSVEDLLRGELGVSISNNGGPGKATSVFLRGTNSDHVLVLIDGIKVGSATLGTTAFQDIPVNQIERVEIVRGPRSSLYGSEAIGGVIQIFTRKGGGPLKPFVSLGGGSHRTYDGATGISGGGEKSWFNASVSGFHTQGINACSGSLTAGCFTIEPDKDGYRNNSGALRGGYRFDNGTDIDVHWMRADGANMFDGSSVNESKSVQEIYGGRFRFTPMTPWQVTLLTGRSSDDSDNFKNSAFKSRFNTERDTVSLQNDVSFGASQLLTVGIDQQDDRIASTTAYPVTSRNNSGRFAQYQGVFGENDLQASLRRDDNEQFGGRTTRGVAWGHGFDGGLRLIASYGTAFKAPTFNQLYFPGFGNPSLRPEESRSAEVGVNNKTGWGRWSLNAYQTEIDDLIAFDASFTPANIDSARIRGLEAKLGSRLAGWDVNTGLTWLDPENRSSGSNTGRVLPRRAQQALRVDMDRAFGPYRFGARLHAEGHRYDDLANTRRLGGYTTVDLRGEYTFVKNWLLQARIDNLFDKGYETAAFFNQPGRSFFFALRYQP